MQEDIIPRLPLRRELPRGAPYSLGGTDDAAASMATGATTPGVAAIPIASFPFAVPVNVIGSTRASPALGLGNVPASSDLFSQALAVSQNLVIASVRKCPSVAILVLPAPS